jgi:uncharacterized protein YkuJ|tara:strand:+ start:1873 stop:2286 length:414 start_codon:yes stop_codon:yes gene_type:complete
MARKKKLYNYSFVDCNKSIPSSLFVKCTETGEKVKMYHKQLVKLIETKYSNNWKLFQATYIKKGNKINYNQIDDYDIRPEGYRKYLVTAYVAAKKDDRLSDLDKRNKLAFLEDCYQKRWSDSLEDRVRSWNSDIIVV